MPPPTSESFIPGARGYRISGTYHLDPTHWTLLVVSEHDKASKVATHYFTTFKQVVPMTVVDKQKHATTVRRLTTILCKNPQQREEFPRSPRLGKVPPQRVVNTSPQRVARSTTSSSSLTRPKNLQVAPIIHLCQTRRNTSMPTVTYMDHPPMSTT
jgi:hypothetical protein